ncbi:hypothetical protein SDC9_152021 [bioreactor metagenome]|uniref:Uncharacterized protein n=1 Tax=bioreactor metagenome TaxID=1076179 RepID=A0A645EWD2_9ZZZZ
MKQPFVIRVGRGHQVDRVVQIVQFEFGRIEFQSNILIGMRLADMADHQQRPVSVLVAVDADIDILAFNHLDRVFPVAEKMGFGHLEAGVMAEQLVENSVVHPPEARHGVVNQCRSHRRLGHAKFIGFILLVAAETFAQSVERHVNTVGDAERQRRKLAGEDRQFIGVENIFLVMQNGAGGLSHPFTIQQMGCEGECGQQELIGIMHHNDRVLNPGVKLRERDTAIEFALSQKRIALGTAVQLIVAFPGVPEVEIHAAQFGDRLEHGGGVQCEKCACAGGRAAIVNEMSGVIVIHGDFGEDFPFVLESRHFRIAY